MTAGHRATVAGNRAAAQAEAARLMALARIPSGATRLGRPPRSLASPALGTPGVLTLVDHKMSWRVGKPFSIVRAWLAAHRPRGLTAEGWSRNRNIRTHQTEMAGTSYPGAASPAWQSASLEISAAIAGAKSTVIRVDAVVVWLDPRPVRSRPGSHPLRVTLASGCPSSDRGVTGVANPGAKLARILTQRLLPPGRPSAGLRCRYYGLDGHPFQSVVATRLGARAAQRAARTMSAIPLSHTDGGVINCPLDTGRYEVLVLAYPGHPDVDLWIHVDGCGGFSNGYISA
ncbi:MAG TPA: hypothetical protein VFI65_32435 [Streptosporangiaceae bacterium]|nr:hypothetical protein [Streptosporangiaceae bacterium]